MAIDRPRKRPLSLLLIALLIALCGALAPATALADDLVPTVEVQAYQSGVGWRAPDASGSSSGGDGIGRPLQRLRLTLDAPGIDGGISYAVYQNGGWSDYAASGQVAGREGASIQAVRMQLVGQAAKDYELAYRSSCMGVGWLGWTSGLGVSGAPNLTAIEAVQVTLVPKGGDLPASDASPVVTSPGLQFWGYVDGKGWDGPRAAGNGIGEDGHPLEGLRIELTGGADRLPGSVRYRVYTSYGWQEWVSDGQEACPVSADAPIQAVQVTLSGAVADLYDVWYHVYVPYFGWLDYTVNGGTAGAMNLTLPADAIQIKFLPKGSAAPGPTGTPLRDLSNTTKVGWQNPAGRPQVSARTVVLPDYCTGHFTYVTPSRISVTATREECIEAFIGRAFDYMGTPFIEPYSCAPGEGVDCSGLVLQCLYACGMDMGIYNPYNHRWLPWQTYNSMNWYRENTFQPVSIGDRQRGDVLYYQGHIAIYLGNDQIIDAQPPYVTTRSMWYANPIGCARPFV